MTRTACLKSILRAPVPELVYMATANLLGLLPTAAALDETNQEAKRNEETDGDANNLPCAQ